MLRQQPSSTQHLQQTTPIAASTHTHAVTTGAAAQTYIMISIYGCPFLILLWL